MKAGQLLINGHYRRQRVTGVQRYANEIIKQFDENKVPFSWVNPPPKLNADMLRQLWMQSVIPFKISKSKLLWSPTNIGPIWFENQVLTLHDIADQVHPEWYDNKYVQWRKIILPRLLNSVRRIITISRFSKQTIEAHYPQTEGKVQVIYNGVRTEHFYPRPSDEIKQLRERLNIEKPFILNVGSLDERKNIHRLTEAWKQLPHWLRKEMNLVIAGESAKKFSFNPEKGYDNSICFTGYVSEKLLPALYSAAQVFVYPSLFEGFGLPVLEAMACGTPVVTSNTTSLKELAADKALTVNPYETDAIAGAIEKMVKSKDSRDQYAAEGQQYANTFRWNKTAKQTKRVLEECIF